MILHHLSLHRTNCTTMLVVTGLVTHNLHTNSSNVTCKFGGRFHCTPSCTNASLNSAFAFVSARVLPFLANALTVSQPVKACLPSNVLHISGPTDAVTFDISMKRVRVCVPDFCNSEACMLSLNVRQRMKTYLYHLHRSQLLRILLRMHELHEAVIVHVPLHAGLTWLEPLYSPWLIFQHLSRFVTNRHFPTNLSVYFYFFHTFSSWLYCRIAARTSSTLSLIVS